MREIKVRETFKIDNLTQDNSWKNIHKYLLNDCDSNEDIMLDFMGVNVNEPWSLNEFCEILKMNNVHFRFTGYDNKQLNMFVNKIKMRCLIDGLFVDRIDTVYIEKAKVKTKEEIKIEKNGNNLVERFVIDENEAVIELYNIYDQIGSASTVYSIMYAIRKINKESNINKFVLKIKRMFIQNNIVELIAKCIVELDLENIELLIDTENVDLAKIVKLNIYTLLNETYTPDKKLLAFCELKLNMPGLLIKYKKSRAIDEFGRQGKGQVVSNRIAIYRGMCRKGSMGTYTLKNGYKLDRTGCILKEIEHNKFVEVDREENISKYLEIFEVHLNEKNELVDKFEYPFDLTNMAVVIDSYDNNSFCTKAEWMSNHDGEMIDDEDNEITELKHDRVVINIEDIGLMDRFLGKQYHFIRAVQMNKNDNKKIITAIGDNGNNISKICTIPERMKIVFNDWRIPVDAMELERAIMETNKALNKLEDNK